MKTFLYFFSYLCNCINKQNGNIISSGSGDGTFIWGKKVNTSNIRDFLEDLRLFIMREIIKRDPQTSFDDVEIQITIINYKYIEDTKCEINRDF
jgi:hypothetical protein